MLRGPVQRLGWNPDLLRAKKALGQLFFPQKLRCPPKLGQRETGTRGQSKRIPCTRRWDRPGETQNGSMWVIWTCLYQLSDLGQGPCFSVPSSWRTSQGLGHHLPFIFKNQGLKTAWARKTAQVPALYRMDDPGQILSTISHSPAPTPPPPN